MSNKFSRAMATRDAVRRDYRQDQQEPPSTAWRPVITEKRWMADVIEAATMFRWAWYHTLDSRGSTPGFPDLILVRPPRLLAVELKAERGKLTPAQAEWLDLLAVCGVETHVWRPSDHASMLRALAPAGVRIRS